MQSACKASTSESAVVVEARESLAHSSTSTTLSSVCIRLLDSFERLNTFRYYSAAHCDRS